MFEHHKAKKRLARTLANLADRCWCGALALGSPMRGGQRLCLNHWGEYNVDHARHTGYWPASGPRP